MIGRYRIYPSWFGMAGAQAPMQELAQREALRLNMSVAGIAITADDHNERGHYLDFEVLYTSSGILQKSS